MNKLWKSDLKSLKRIRFGIFILMILGGILTVSAITEIIVGSQENALTIIAFALTAISIGLSVSVYVIQTIADWNNTHRAVGGSIPSKEVDKKILEMYQVIMVGKGLKPRIKKTLSFSTNHKASMKLVKHIGEHCFTFKEDVFKQTYTCGFMYKWNHYEATSASKEMAICMAVQQAYEANLAKKLVL
ncbi:MAG: hypothetical protein ABS939_00220 [Psychrobacillus sp.]